MESIAEIVKNLLVIIIVTSFLELLLPEGGVKPFVRFAIGLFIIITVLNPILSFIFNKDTFEIGWWDSRPLTPQEESINNAGKELNHEINQIGQQTLKEKVEGQISSLVLLVPGVKESRAKVEIDGEGVIKSMEISVSPEIPGNFESTSEAASLLDRQKMEKNEAENIRLKINELIKNFYGLDGVRIKVVFEGG